MPDKLTVEFKGEFTWDIVSVAPFAYWLHKRGLLEQTIGPIGSEPIYFFSPKHTASGCRNEGFEPLEKIGYGNIKGTIYGKELPDKRWEIPPYREHFKNDRFSWDKPLLIISNKYTEEWGKGPVNFISCECLMRIIAALYEKYTIVYIRPTYGEKGIAYDGHTLYHWWDYALLKNYFDGKIILFNELLEQNQDLDYNTLQFMLHANCNKFISCFGGNSAMCSIMGGTNFVWLAGHPGDGMSGHTACLFPESYYCKEMGIDIKMRWYWNDLIKDSVKEFGGDMRGL